MVTVTAKRHANKAGHAETHPETIQIRIELLKEDSIELHHELASGTEHLLW